MTSARRPIWMPGRFSRVFLALWRFGKVHVTFKRAVVAVILVPLGGYLFYQAFVDNTILIEPFSVPSRYEDAGLTPEAMSRLIADAVADLEDQGKSSLTKDRLALASEVSDAPDLEVPGTSLGIRTLVEAIRKVFGRESTRIHGAVVSALTNRPEVANPDVEIILRVVRGSHRSALLTLSTPGNDPYLVAQKAAEGVLSQINPYLLGAYLLEKGDLEGATGVAEDMISGAVDDRREVAKAYLLWGLALDRQGKSSGAIPLFERAAVEDPKLALAYNNWGYMLYKLGKPGEAVALYEKSIAVDPKLALASNNLGVALYDLGRPAEAEALYRKAAARNPKSPDPYVSWANALRNRGKPAEAIPIYEQAIAVDPKSTEAYNNWGNALQDLGRPAEAIPLYEKAIAVDPKSAEAYNNWGYALNTLGKPAEAIPLYAKATALDARYARAYRNWAQALDMLGNPAEAEEKRRKAAEISGQE